MSLLPFPGDADGTGIHAVVGELDIEIRRSFLRDFSFLGCYKVGVGEK
jgi:hypothetical protein